ncbi:MAG: hypothetical protein AB8B97_05260 [Granulosicoccus sp.]
MSTTLLQADTEPNQFVTVTPAGCYYAVENNEPTIARQLLRRILGTQISPELSVFASLDKESIFELQKSGFVILSELPVTLPEGNLTSLLPHVLPALSERQEVVLTESLQGLYLDFSGVGKKEAEELAVMAAAFHTMTKTRNSLLVDRLAVNSRAFGVVDPAGNSEIGFWPLHISDNVFTLIILGIPRFNSAQFCTLVWALIERYGVSENP